MDQVRKFEVTFTNFHVVCTPYVTSGLSDFTTSSAGPYSKENRTFVELETFFVLGWSSHVEKKDRSLTKMRHDGAAFRNTGI